MAILTDVEVNELAALRAQIESLKVTLLRAQLKVLGEEIAALTTAKEEHF